MDIALSLGTLTTLGLEETIAHKILERLQGPNALQDPASTWQEISSLLTPAHPFEVHHFLYEWIYQNNDPVSQPGPAWFPPKTTQTHIDEALTDLELKDYPALYRWSIQNRSDYWAYAINKLGIQFKKKYQDILNLDEGVEEPHWLEGAQLNIVDSCFKAPAEKPAIIYQEEQGGLHQVSYEELYQLVARVTNSLRALGFKPGDAIAIDLPMTVEAIAIYLGVVAAGCHVVAIADSFAPPEIATRLKIADAKAIFTQDVFPRNGKLIPLYQKVIDANAPQAIVIFHQEESMALRDGDLHWEEFLVLDEEYNSEACDPHQISNVLFSSGTTGDPKAIPWDHTTPIKSAADAHFHQDIHPEDIITWPTNLGWMMGPWLIYASLINQATIALYYGIPTGRPFCEFVQNAKVTILGIVPSMVKAWKENHAIDGLDWSHLKAFSSTGESSNAVDMLYLMSKANYRPVIEYCGGTEIGGAYITSTLVEPNIPSTFSTPTLGLDLVLLDDDQKVSNKGEIALIPPSIGLSRSLLNKDHYKVYYEEMPVGPKGECLRRHGDEMEQLANGHYRALGRVDDTMNIGGIKVSSAEIEHALLDIEGLVETAAIAITPPTGGPSSIVIYAVAKPEEELNQKELHTQIQKAISQKLNPLFKVQDVKIIEKLPRTSSNKVMRRVLRDRYQAG